VKRTLIGLRNFFTRRSTARTRVEQETSYNQNNTPPNLATVSNQDTSSSDDADSEYVLPPIIIYHYDISNEESFLSGFSAYMKTAKPPIFSSIEVIKHVGYGIDLNGDLSSLTDSIVDIFRKHKMLPEDKIQKYSAIWNQEPVDIVPGSSSSLIPQND